MPLFQLWCFSGWLRGLRWVCRAGDCEGFLEEPCAWSLGGGEIDPGASWETRAPGAWGFSAAHWIQEQSSSKELGFGSSSSSSSYKVSFGGISVKAAAQLLLWLCHALWQTLQAVCLLLCGCSCSTSLYFTAASRKRRGRFPLFPAEQFLFPRERLCPVCWFPAGQNEWLMKQQSGSAALHWTLLSKLNTSFSWALSSLNEFGICHLSAASGMCRHSKCLPNLWLYSCNLFFLPLP